MTRSISLSLPTTGSSLSCRASSVRSRPNSSSVGVRDRGLRRLRGCVVILKAHHFAPCSFQVYTELAEHARCQAFALADQAEEQVLGADVVVVQLPGFVVGQVDDALGSRGQLHVLTETPVASGDLPLDLGSDAIQTHAHPVEYPRRYAVVLAHEAQQQMLGGHEVLAESPGFFLREEDDSARSLSKPLPHFAVPPLRMEWS